MTKTEALKYLKEQRGFSLKMIKYFRLGCRGDWISIPFFQEDQCVLIKYRRYQGEGDKFEREKGHESALFVSPYQTDNRY